MKKVRIITMSLAMLLLPLAARAMSAIEIIETDYEGQRTSITLGNASLKVNTGQAGGQSTVLHVSNAQGQTLFIYDVSGAPIKRIKVDSPDKTYELSLKKGCYIVKVGNIVRKISVS